MVCLGKLEKLAPILTSRDASIKVKGKVYSASVQCAMTYGSGTRPMSVEDMRRLEGAEKMTKWTCGVTLRNGKTGEEIRNRLGIVSVSDLVRKGD
jgi:hypothetical protein